jgi:hypothetical protein
MSRKGGEVDTAGSNGARLCAPQPLAIQSLRVIDPRSAQVPSPQCGPQCSLPLRQDEAVGDEAGVLESFAELFGIHLLHAAIDETNVPLVFVDLIGPAHGIIICKLVQAPSQVDIIKHEISVAKKIVAAGFVPALTPKK